LTSYKETYKTEKM